MTDLKGPEGVNPKTDQQKTDGIAKTPEEGRKDRKNAPEDKDKFGKILGEEEGKKGGPLAKGLPFSVADEKGGKEGKVGAGGTGTVAYSPDKKSKQAQEEVADTPKVAPTAAPGQEESVFGLSALHPKSDPTVKTPEQAAVTPLISGSSDEPGIAGLSQEAGAIFGAITAGAQKVSETFAPSADLKTLATQLADHIVTLKQEGLTETMVTIKQPPLFAGATVIIREFAQAKGEYNLSFANLSPKAQELLSMPANQGDLRMTLNNGGIPVHIITATTEPEQTLADTGFSRDGDEGGSEGFDEGSDQEREREEGEEKRR